MECNINKWFDGKTAQETINQDSFFYIKNLNMRLRNIYQGQKDTEQIHGKIQVRENPHSSIFSAVYLSSSSLCNSND